MSDPAPPTDPGSSSKLSADRRVNLLGRTLRQHAAHGTVINALFLVFVSTIACVKGFAVAAFLTRTEFGVWGIVVATVGTLGILRDIGIADRYIQQDEEDQEVAFHKAFTLELMIQAAFAGLILIVSPIAAVVYGRSDVLYLGLACVVIPFATALQVPIWVHYRRMNYRLQRILMALDPVVGLIVTLALAAAGFGFWSLFIGVVAGQLTTALLALRFSPYPIRLRYDRGTLREYWAFSVPLFTAALSVILLTNVGVLVGNAFLGVAAVGSITLANQIAQLTTRVDGIISGALYPAVCAVRERTELLYESFSKSNRAGMMWGIPFGAAAALFAEPLTTHLLGEQWRPAVPFLQVFGVVAGLDQIAFNWTVYLRATGRTKPIAVVTWIAALVYVAASIPLTAAFGESGFVAAIALMGAVGLVGRCAVMRQLFPQFGPVRHAARALASTLPAVAAILGLRASGFEFASDEVSALVELGLFLTLAVSSTFVIERALVREMVGYVLRTNDPPTSVAVPA